MRTTLISLLIIGLSGTIQAQTNVESLEATASSAVSMSDIDDQYGDALNTESETAVFSGRESEFFNGYRQLIVDISSHLRARGFEFHGDTRMFTRIYFDADGSIDHFYYSREQAGFSPRQERQFNSLLTPFLSSYRFPLASNEPFAQCSPIVYASGK